MGASGLITGNILQTNTGMSGPFTVGPAWNAGGPNPTFPQYDKAIGLIATIVAGSPSYTVQVTADNPPNSSGNWNNHDVLVNQTVSMNSNIAYPVTGIRLVVTGVGIVNLGMCRWC